MHLKLYITKNGILLSTRDLGIEPETHDEGLFMWSRISSLTALNRKRCLPNIQLLTAHFDNNRYKERVGTGNLAVNSICVSDKYYLNLMYGSGSYMVPPNFLVFYVLNDSKTIFFFCRKLGL